jgi:hypothetical protein
MYIPCQQHDPSFWYERYVAKLHALPRIARLSKDLHNMHLAIARLALLLGASLFAATLASPVQHTNRLTRRTTAIYPIDLCGMNGNVLNASSLIGSPSGSAVFNNPSAATYNFGSLITDAMRVTLSIGDADRDQYIGLVPFSVDADGTCLTGGSNDPNNAGAAWFCVTGPGNFSTPSGYAGGEFRYLSILHNTTGAVQVRGIVVETGCDEAVSGRS